MLKEHWQVYVCQIHRYSSCALRFYSTSVIGTDDAVSIKDWYAGTDHKIEQIETSTGAVLVDTQVQQLVSAMAAFVPPATGEFELSQTLSDELEPVIASAWQS